MIRKAVSEDLEQILTVLSAAKAFMVKTGNAAQWEPGYPDTVISGDIAAGNCYVEEEGGTIHGVFVCIPGDDPTYRVIENGRWLNDRPYATIHRAGSDGALPGFFGRCWPSAAPSAPTCGRTPTPTTMSCSTCWKRTASAPAARSMPRTAGPGSPTSWKPERRNNYVSFR